MPPQKNFRGRPCCCSCWCWVRWKAAFGEPGRRSSCFSSPWRFPVHLRRPSLSRIWLKCCLCTNPINYLLNNQYKLLYKLTKFVLFRVNVVGWARASFLTINGTRLMVRFNLFVEFGRHWKFFWRRCVLVASLRLFEVVFSAAFLFVVCLQRFYTWN